MAMSCLRFEKLAAAVWSAVIKLVWFLVTKKKLIEGQ